jgi:RNA polymerase sigma-70 factor (family 1)
LSSADPDTSKVLLSRIAAGEEEAFTALFHQWRDKLYFYILRITHSEAKAEDVLQDVFTRIWLHRSRLQDIQTVDAYLYSMAKNQAISCIRQMARETLATTVLARADSQPAGPSDEHLVQKELQHTLHDIIHRLPPQQRLVYTLSREQGLKKEEIAARLNISSSTVKNHMTHALRTIRQELEIYWQIIPACITFALTFITKR